MRKRGFTLIEILTVVSIIGILAGIVLISTVQVRIIGRNAQRSTDITSVLNAIYQYALDNSNQLPSVITTTPTGICRTGASSCTGLINLSVLTTNSQYLVALPFDPISTSTTNTNYLVSKTANNRVLISAPYAEGSSTISITR